MGERGLDVAVDFADFEADVGPVWEPSVWGSLFSGVGLVPIESTGGGGKDGILQEGWPSSVNKMVSPLTPISFPASNF